MPRRRDLLHEIVVKRLELLLQLLQLLGGVRPRRRIDLRVSADAGRLDVRPELFVHAAGDEFAADDADRSGQRRRLCDDNLRGHRNVVPAGGCKIGHRRDERPIGALVLRDRQLAPDRVRRCGRPARTVDAQDDRADGAVLARLADVFDQRIGTHDRAVERVVAALAAGNRAGRIDHRNPRPTVETD